MNAELIRYLQVWMLWSAILSAGVLWARVLTGLLVALLEVIWPQGRP